MIFAAAAMAISPWVGSDLPTATQAAARYRLAITGKPGGTVHLRATGVAGGWIAAFCDTRICSPSQVTEKIPASGRIVVQFELIRETDDAAHRSGATIVADDGRRVVVPPASR